MNEKIEFEGGVRFVNLLYSDRPDYFVNEGQFEPIPDTCGQIKPLVASESGKLSLAYAILSGRATPHKHKIMDETYTVVKGRGYLTIGNLPTSAKFPIKQGDSVAIPKNTFHYLETEKGETIEVLVATTPQFIKDDVIERELNFEDRGPEPGTIIYSDTIGKQLSIGDQ